jgi:poly-gamma-glutamate capsule biosynthesis protein CapA/YwtB (metallophosphatase superfamily)
MSASEDHRGPSASVLTLFFSGDVMLGRGIDQILPQPSDPRLFESHVTSATKYVELAEAASGPIPRSVDFSYVWGEALAAINAQRPDFRIVNLETSITKSGTALAKGINYKMNPDNVGCLMAMHIDCCVLANNHVLDWGRAGLIETLATLEGAPIVEAGAGRTLRDAAAPAVLTAGGDGRVLVFGFGAASSGIPSDWAAGSDHPGINLVADFSDREVLQAASALAAAKRSGDLAIASIHWGSNWGYRIEPQQPRFARALIDTAGFDVVHGHSSHHPRAIEIYRQKLILYGCGDFINDYEGIAGYQEFRDDLVIAYLATCSRSSGSLVELRLLPFQIKKFRLTRAAPRDVAWLQTTLDRECARFGTRIVRTDANTLAAQWR